MLPRELGGDLVHLAEPPHRDQERFVVVQARGLEVPDLLAQVPLQLIRIRVVDSASAQHRCTPLPDLVLQRVHGHAPDRRNCQAPQPAEGAVGGGPLPALIGQLGAPGFRDLVVPSPPAFRRQPPLGTDVAESFQTVQERIQHAVRPLQLAAGELPHPLQNRIAVTGALHQDREDERCRHRGDQVLVDVHGDTLYLAALGTKRL